AELNNINLKHHNLNDLSSNNICQTINTNNISSYPQTSHSFSPNVNQIRIESTLDRDHRRAKLRLDKEYYVFRELVMSERTYKKDIELINTWFKEDVSKETTRPAEMEGKSALHSNRSIGDILKDIIQWLPLYERLIERLPFILERINASFRHNKDFERINLVILIELQRDITGMDNIVQSGRTPDKEEGTAVIQNRKCLQSSFNWHQ
ncbi:unnamed protein product, partial [Medioppia subpectinata]